MNWITKASKENENLLIEIRRELHKIPEIGTELPFTRAYVCRKLEQWNIPYKKNEGDDGIIVDILGNNSGRAIAYRADMDAINVKEELDLPFRSMNEGKMHGCGHDAHTAILLLVAKILTENKDKLCGKVRLLFQTGEETGNGAKKMLENGAVDGIDEIYSIHVGNIAGSHLSSGDIVILPGAVSAGKNKFTLTVKGVGTHSAFPHMGVDPILIAARIVNGCEELAARELPAGSAAVLSFGSLNAGIDHNTIPEEAIIKGSIRCQSDSMREFLGERLEAIAKNIATAYRGECIVDLKRGSATIVNDKKLAKRAYDAVKATLNEAVIDETPASLMGSDDFANYLKIIPGVYFFLHTNSKEKGITEPNHSPRFDIDESVLWRGVAAYLAIAADN